MRGKTCRATWHRGGALLVLGVSLAAAPCLAQTEASQAPPEGAPAQGYGGPHRGGPEHRAEMLQRQLGLSSDQFTQVKALLETERSQMEALHANSSLSREDMHAQMTTIHQGTDTKIRALLTADQASKFDAMQARMRERMQERQGEPGPPPPPDGTPQP